MDRRLEARTRLVAAGAVIVTFLVPLALQQPASSETGPALGAIVVPLGAGDPGSEYVPTAEATLLALLNQVRGDHHLPPLVANGNLHEAARLHSRDMAVQGYVGHGSRGGQSFIERLEAFVRPGTLVGENVIVAETPEEANGAFLASPGHLENMLNPRFHAVGIGVATAGRVGLIITEDFAQ